jgi:hypothetical protein
VCVSPGPKCRTYSRIVLNVSGLGMPLIGSSLSAAA